MASSGSYARGDRAKVDGEWMPEFNSLEKLWFSTPAYFKDRERRRRSCSIEEPGGSAGARLTWWYEVEPGCVVKLDSGFWHGVAFDAVLFASLFTLLWLKHRSARAIRRRPRLASKGSSDRVS